MSPSFSKRDDYLRLAGFFEGEGCISVNHRKRGSYSYLRVSASQVIRNKRCHKFLELYKKYFGGNIYESKRSIKGRKKTSRYIVTCRRAVKLLETLLPFLEEKKDRVELAIKLSKIKLSSNGKDSFKKLKKKKLAEEIMKLNHLAA